MYEWVLWMPRGDVINSHWGKKEKRVKSKEGRGNVDASQMK